jgi:hypothetical protein
MTKQTKNRLIKPSEKPTFVPTIHSRHHDDMKTPSHSLSKDKEKDTSTRSPAAYKKMSSTSESKSPLTITISDPSQHPTFAPATNNPTFVPVKETKEPPSENLSTAKPSTASPTYNPKRSKTSPPVSLPANVKYGFLSISPLMITNNEIVTVNYQSRIPSIFDWIGAFTPANFVGDISNSKAAIPFLHGCCTGSCPWRNENFLGMMPLDNHYLTTGKGTLRFNLTNIRSDIRFYYFVGNQTHHKVVAKSSEVVSFQNVNEPLKNRIMPTHDPNIFQLLWSTKSSRIPFLKWGLQSNSHHFISYAKTSKIEKNSLCGAPANSVGFHDLGTINTAIFNLSLIEDIRRSINTTERNDLKLYYIFGDSHSALQSKEFQFIVPPLPGQHSSSIDSSKNSSSGSFPESSTASSSRTSLAIIGDLGVGFPFVDATSESVSFWDDMYPDASNTVASLSHYVQSPNSTVKALLHIGDLSYANGYLVVWDYYLEMIQPIVSRIAYLPAVGNHEVEDPHQKYSLYPLDTSGGECGTVNGRLFPMPVDSALGQDNVKAPWWSYETGLFHIIAISTEHHYAIGSPQYRWLLQDLQAINYTMTPWVVLMGHRPMYVSSQQCCDIGTDLPVMQSLMTNLEDIIHQYHVNIGLSGHLHNFQRQSAAYRNQTVTKSKLITDKKDSSLSYSLYDHPQSTIWMVVGASGAGPTSGDRNYSWSEKSWNNRYGYAILTAINETTAEWQLIEGKTNAVLDHVYIVQDPPRKNGTEPPSWVPLVKNSAADDYNKDSQHNNTGFGTMFIMLLGIIFVFFVGKLYYSSTNDKEEVDEGHDDSSSPLLDQKRNGKYKHGTPRKKKNSYGTYPDEKHHESDPVVTLEEA